MKNGFLASTKKTNKPTKQRFAAETDTQLSIFFLSFFLSCFRSISGDEKSTFGEEGKEREENKEGEQEQEFFGLEIRFCEFSGFVGEGVDVAVVLLAVVVCG